MIEASVIIGAYNQKEVLKKTLESLFNQTYPPDRYEIVLMDSLSSDGTQEMVADLKPPCKLNYIRQENRGKVNARNNAIRQAQGKLILLTDADVPVEKNWVENHINHQRQFKSTALVGKELRIKDDGRAVPEFSRQFKLLQKIPWSYFMTGNVSIKKETLLKAGLFDEDFKGYGWEDIELGYRLHKMGVPLRYLPSAVNYHHHPVTNQDFLKTMHQMGQSAIIFYRKHPNLQIKYYLGLNPLALTIHSLIQKNNWLYNFIEKKAPGSRFFRYILEQYHYLSGAKEALRNA